MKKFELVLVVLTILGIIALALMITVHPPDNSVRGSIGPTSGTKIGIGMVENQTAIMKDRIMAVALNDSVLKHIINDSSSQAQISYIKPGGTGIYIKDRERYAGVSVNANGGGEPLRFTVVVDTWTMREMGMHYGGVPPLANSWVIIPPGNGVYQMMSGYFDLSSPRRYAVPVIGSGISNLDLTPADAKLYPLILDENNFSRYMNGSDYGVPDLIDMDTGEIVRIDGSAPLTSSWKSSYILPEERQSYNVNSPWASWYYLILLNMDPDTDIKLVYRMPYPPIYED